MIKKNRSLPLNPKKMPKSKARVKSQKKNNQKLIKNGKLQKVQLQKIKSQQKK